MLEWPRLWRRNRCRRDFLRSWRPTTNGTEHLCTIKASQKFSSASLRSSLVRRLHSGSTQSWTKASYLSTFIQTRSTRRLSSTTRRRLFDSGTKLSLPKVAMRLTFSASSLTSPSSLTWRLRLKMSGLASLKWLTSCSIYSFYLVILPSPWPCWTNLHRTACSVSMKRFQI